MSVLRDIIERRVRRERIRRCGPTGEGVEASPSYRGRVGLKRELCIGCSLCEKDCPSAAIKIVQDEKGKRPVFFLDRCMFCGQCKESCPTKAIYMSSEPELPVFDRKELEVR
ncbi:MAG: 4Fe-4S binding protein [Candidatus Methanosuratincola sp.]